MRLVAFLACAGCWSTPAAVPVANTQRPSSAKAELGPVEVANFHIEIINGRKVTVIQGLHEPDDITPPTPSVEEVSRFVAARLEGLRACYVAYLTTMPGAHGIVDVRLGISVDGTPNASVSGLPGIEPCIEERVSSWDKLPAPRDGQGQPSGRGFTFHVAFTP